MIDENPPEPDFYRFTLFSIFYFPFSAFWRKTENRTNWNCCTFVVLLLYFHEIQNSSMSSMCFMKISKYSSFFYCIVFLFLGEKSSNNERDEIFKSLSKWNPDRLQNSHQICVIRGNFVTNLWKTRKLHKVSVKWGGKVDFSNLFTQICLLLLFWLILISNKTKLKKLIK